MQYINVAQMTLKLTDLKDVLTLGSNPEVGKYFMSCGFEAI